MTLGFHPRFTITNRITEALTRRTLQRDLRKLEELGLIQRKGAARQSFYKLGENLP